MYKQQNLLGTFGCLSTYITNMCAFHCATVLRFYCAIVMWKTSCCHSDAVNFKQICKAFVYLSFFKCMHTCPLLYVHVFVCIHMHKYCMYVCIYIYIYYIFVLYIHIYITNVHIYYAHLASVKTTSLLLMESKNLTAEKNHCQ